MIHCARLEHHIKEDELLHTRSCRAWCTAPRTPLLLRRRARNHAARGSEEGIGGALEAEFVSHQEVPKKKVYLVSPRRFASRLPNLGSALEAALELL